MARTRKTGMRSTPTPSPATTSPAPSPSPAPSRGTRVVRSSRLDHLASSSELKLSQFWGFWNLAWVGSLYFLVAAPTLNYIDTGTFIDPLLAHAMFDDVHLLLVWWLKFFLWSYLSLGIVHLLNADRIGIISLRVLKHAAQSVLIFYGLGSCLYHDWPIIPSGFINILAAVYFMKMHAYATTMSKWKESDPQKFKDNLSFYRFTMFLVYPVLVFEAEYPKGDGFRPVYFIQKWVMFLGAMAIVYILTTDYVIPVIRVSNEIHFLVGCLRLIVPFIAIDMLMFFMLFECICNLFAEVTNFGDRDFYEDWWNSTTYDEYARKWNRPVHEFLYEYVYLDYKKRFNLNKMTATLITFLFSALMHEMILSVCFRVVRPYMFISMLSQIPLSLIGQKNKGTGIGNLSFWLSINFGMGVLSMAYGRQWAARQTDFKVI